MLSVGGSGGRSRSKSPGRRDTSRTRDIRAPSPGRRMSSTAAAPPSSRSRKYYEEDEDEDLVSDSEDDRRRGSYALEKVRSRDSERRRGKYDEEEEESESEEEESSRYESRHSDTRRRSDYGRRRDEPSRGQEYAIPGQFDQAEERAHRKDVRAASISSGTRGGYEKLGQYQYAQVDARDLSYTSKGGTHYTRTPSETGPAYVRNPGSQVSVESSRQRHRDSYDSRSTEYSDIHASGSRYKTERERQKELERADERRKELARLEKERAELAAIEAKRRELDHLRQERDEREAELRQKQHKTVTIRDDRDHRRDDRRGSSRRSYDSDDSEEDGRLDKLYHDRYKHEDHYDDRHADRREERRRERSDIKSKHGSDERRSSAQVVQIHPGGKGSLVDPSAALSSKTHRLSISGLAPGAMSLAAPGAAGHTRRGSFGAPPGSPLLESYKGTYQTISPMPSPMALAHHPDDSDLSELDLPGGFGGKARRRHDDEASTDESDVSRDERKPKSVMKRHREIRESMYDPEEDALALTAELKRSPPNPHILVKTLPRLRNDSISLLRAEYKKHAKIGGKGINIAKHIKMKLGTTNVGKAAYATALGRWESEAHWANFWYQSGSSRRELLIEALFGRSNAEIKAIKEAFSDKRYGDSLTKCMESELKKDKFRLAVLKVLEAKRGDAGEEVDKKLVKKDIKDLRTAVASKDGGETAMINIIVSRSDEHLRYMIREYEEDYGENFARKMISKSQNLVGETLAHILNGVINRPVRDALLLHQAIAETSKDRAELIISRLVRFHWEPRHLERIKVEYRKRYKVTLEEDIEEGTKGEFCAYCLALCKGATV